MLLRKQGHTRVAVHFHSAEHKEGLMLHEQVLVVVTILGILTLHTLPVYACKCFPWPHDTVRWSGTRFTLMRALIM